MPGKVSHYSALPSLVKVAAVEESQNIDLVWRNTKQKHAALGDKLPFAFLPNFDAKLVQSSSDALSRLCGTPYPKVKIVRIPRISVNGERVCTHHENSIPWD